MVSVNWTNMTSLGGLPAAANTVTGGSFWTTILFMLFVIVLLVTLSWGFETALIISSFIGLALGILLLYAGLVAWQWVAVFAAILLFTFIYVGWTSKQYNY